MRIYFALSNQEFNSSELFAFPSSHCSELISLPFPFPSLWKPARLWFWTLTLAHTTKVHTLEINTHPHVETSSHPVLTYRSSSNSKVSYVYDIGRLCFSIPEGEKRTTREAVQTEETHYFPHTIL